MKNKRLFLSISLLFVSTLAFTLSATRNEGIGAKKLLAENGSTITIDNSEDNSSFFLNGTAYTDQNHNKVRFSKSNLEPIEIEGENYIQYTPLSNSATMSSDSNYHLRNDYGFAINQIEKITIQGIGKFNVEWGYLEPKNSTGKYVGMAALRDGHYQEKTSTDVNTTLVFDEIGNDKPNYFELKIRKYDDTQEVFLIKKIIIEFAKSECLPGESMYYLENGIRYYLYEDHAVVAGDDGLVGTSVVIPSTVKGLPVTGIIQNAFYQNKTITSVTIPSTCTTLGDSCFSYCNNLKTINGLNNVNRFESMCLYNIPLQVPDGKLIFTQENLYLAGSSFGLSTSTTNSTNVTQVIFEDSVVMKLSDYYFLSTSLMSKITTIIIGDNINYKAMIPSNFTSLSTIRIKKDVKQPINEYYSKNNIVYYRRGETVDSVCYVGVNETFPNNTFTFTNTMSGNLTSTNLKNNKNIKIVDLTDSCESISVPDNFIKGADQIETFIVGRDTKKAFALNTYAFKGSSLKKLILPATGMNTISCNTSYYLCLTSANGFPADCKIGVYLDENGKIGDLASRYMKNVSSFYYYSDTHESGTFDSSNNFYGDPVPVDSYLTLV